MRFANARFHRDAEFQETAFRNKARFGGSQYCGFARFNSATFLNKVQFQDCSFTVAIFRDTIFNMGARFYELQFNAYATFARARFMGYEADFSGVVSQRTFNLTQTDFQMVPDFIQASFKEAPNLDDIGLSFEAEPGNFWHSCFKASTPHVAVKCRALRKIAILGHDHHNERTFLKAEIRAQRHVVDKFWTAAFWFGILYDALSDFGCSIMRPLYVWLVFPCLAFSAIYFLNAGVRASEWLVPCAGDGASKTLKAITLSAANAVPLIGLSRNDVAKAFYNCISLESFAVNGAQLSKSDKLFGAQR